MQTEEEKRKSHINSVKKYKRKAEKQYLLQVNLKTDMDIINKMESVPNKNGYIKKLIRDDIENERTYINLKESNN